MWLWMALLEIDVHLKGVGLSSLAQVPKPQEHLCEWQTPKHVWEGNFPTERCWADRRVAYTLTARYVWSVSSTTLSTVSLHMTKSYIFPERPEKFLPRSGAKQSKPKKNKTKTICSWKSHEFPGTVINENALNTQLKYLLNLDAPVSAKKYLFFKTDLPLQLRWRC